VFCQNVFNLLADTEFHELVGLSKESVVWLINQIKIGHNGRPKIFSIKDEVLLFLLHIRHYPVDVFLASVWYTSKQNIRNIRNRMLDEFCEVLSPFVTLQTLEWRLRHSCKILHSMYTFVLDGSEQPATGSANPILDTSFYSAKKKKHTVNILVVASLNKKILYISPSYPGSVNDIEIVRRTRHLWYDLLEKNENGLGDNGFNGLDEDGIQIDSPPDRNSPAYKIFSSQRIIIENVFADLKDWGVLHDEIRMPVAHKEELLETHNKNWRVVCGLLNKFRWAT
jgi:hypothetical protein